MFGGASFWSRVIEIELTRASSCSINLKAISTDKNMQTRYQLKKLREQQNAWKPPVSKENWYLGAVDYWNR